MFLTKLTINVRSREFRRDYANIHEMHRTVMSGFPDVRGDAPARQAHGVLWRLDSTHGGFVQYVQSRTSPDWSRLPAGYLLAPAEVRSLQPVLDAISTGRKLSFRMVANPTQDVLRDGEAGRAGSRKRVPHRTAEKQIQWLIRKGDQHGFVVPSAADGQPDLAPSPAPTLTGQKQNQGKITVEPVRFDGHLVIIDSVAFTESLINGIGRAKAYGCGLLSLAPARSAAAC